MIEQNRDAQLRSLLTLETRISKDQLRSVLVYGGFPLSARHVVEGILNGYGAATVKVRGVKQIAIENFEE